MGVLHHVHGFVCLTLAKLQQAETESNARCSKMAKGLLWRSEWRFRCSGVAIQKVMMKKVLNLT